MIGTRAGFSAGDEKSKHSGPRYSLAVEFTGLPGSTEEDKGLGERESDCGLQFELLDIIQWKMSGQVGCWRERSQIITA